MTFRAFYKEGDNKEFDLLIYGESCSYFDPGERGRFRALTTMTVYKDDLPVFQSEKEKTYYIDDKGNVYPSKKSNKVLFNVNDF